MRLNEKIFFEAMAFVDERFAYGSCMDKNMLCKIDSYSGECEFVSVFPDENLKSERLHMKAITVGNNIIFSPANARNICIYNYTENTFDNISVLEDSENSMNYKSSLKYAEIVQYGDTIYVFPASANEIIKLNKNNRSIEKISLMYENKYLFRKDGLLRGDKLFLPSSNSNAVLVFDFKSDNVNVVGVGENNNGSWSICDDGNELWIIPYAPGNVIKWNPETNMVSEFGDFPSGFTYMEKMFIKGIYDDEKIFAIPSGANMTVSINIKTGTMEMIEKYEEKGMFAYLGTYGKELLLMKCPSWKNWVRYENNDMLLWDDKNKSMVNVRPYTLINKGAYVYNCLHDANMVIKEQEIKLEDFLECVASYT